MFGDNFAKSGVSERRVLQSPCSVRCAFQVCAENFGDLCGVVGQHSTETLLVSGRRELCVSTTSGLLPTKPSSLCGYESR